MASAVPAVLCAGDGHAGLRRLLCELAVAYRHALPAVRIADQPRRGMWRVPESAAALRRRGRGVRLRLAARAIGSTVQVFR